MQIKKTQTNKQQFKPNQAMKAKKMTQKLTLLTFTALFIAFMFNACSDVTSPNEGISETGENALISQEHEDLQDVRRRVQNRRLAIESNPPECQYSDGAGEIRYGANLTYSGDFTYSFKDGGIVFTFNMIGDYKIDDIKIGLSNQDDLGSLPPGHLSAYKSENDDEFEKQSPIESWPVTISSLSDHGINEGDDVYFRIHVGHDGETAWVEGSSTCSTVGSFGSAG